MLNNVYKTQYDNILWMSQIKCFSSFSSSLIKRMFLQNLTELTSDRKEPGRFDECVTRGAINNDP